MEGREAPPRDVKAGAGTGRVDRKEVRAPDLEGRRADHGGGRQARAPDTRRVRANRRGPGHGQARQEEKGGSGLGDPQGAVGAEDVQGWRHGDSGHPGDPPACRTMRYTGSWRGTAWPMGRAGARAASRG